MKCPVCPEITLVMSDRQGIEIDYCPKCRGVWLDRGELDKIIAKSETAQTLPVSKTENLTTRYWDSADDYRKDSYSKKRKSILSEIFD